MFWARTYLSKVGAIENSERGVWSITAAGRGLTEADVQKVVGQVREMARKPRSVPAPDEPEIIEGEQPEESWRDQTRLQA
jgi:restriction system protein